VGVLGTKRTYIINLEERMPDQAKVGYWAKSD
jgi:hypothetical protein